MQVPLCNACVDMEIWLDFVHGNLKEIGIVAITLIASIATTIDSIVTTLPELIRHITLAAACFIDINLTLLNKKVLQELHAAYNNVECVFFIFKSHITYSHFEWCFAWLFLWQRFCYFNGWAILLRESALPKIIVIGLEKVIFPLFLETPCKVPDLSPALAQHNTLWHCWIMELLTVSQVVVSTLLITE